MDRSAASSGSWPYRAGDSQNSQNGEVNRRTSTRAPGAKLGLGVEPINGVPSFLGLAYERPQRHRHVRGAV